MIEAKEKPDLNEDEEEVIEDDNDSIPAGGRKSIMPIERIWPRDDS
jgi:hypothetical protein